MFACFSKAASVSCDPVASTRTQLQKLCWSLRKCLRPGGGKKRSECFWFYSLLMFEGGVADGEDGAAEMWNSVVEVKMLWAREDV